jgi:hypothetical protein
LNKEMIHLLCTIIRETGASDSAAAARAALHPSTVSRWKRDNLHFAILLRTAREDFRLAQLEIIQREAQAGRATSWRAAAWLLERIFPEDYAPRARERAQFQEQFDERAAREVEGEEIALPDREEPLQNVQNSPELAPEALPCPAEAPAADGLSGIRPLGGPLQNVRNSTSGRC